MSALPVEWVLAIYYGPSAHRATYGRLNNTKYTKDYIQLSRKTEFLATVSRLFPVAGGAGAVPITYQWPSGSAPGEFVFNSADRPHLKWETNRGAPRAWKMALEPSENTAETIVGDPSHQDFAAAERELEQLAARGAGQPYLLAIKLRDETNRLHLRAYLQNPSDDYAWADLGIAPADIQALALKTSQQSALAWSTFQSGGAQRGAMVDDAISLLIASVDHASVINAFEEDKGRALANYLRQPGYGLFFEPTRNHDAWSLPAPIPERLAPSVREILEALETRFPPATDTDALAESTPADPDEVAAFREQVRHESFEVPDSTATVKTRGSAQRVFADNVKSNYGFICAITGIGTRDFLVAAHIVPWSQDQSIRLDPSNGICLSLIMDRAFEKGYLLIEDDTTVRVNWARVGDDPALRIMLEPYDGRRLNEPTNGAPKVEYLRRRRAMVTLDI